MVIERTSVGLDVHARSVVAAAIDEVSGELTQRRLGASVEEVVAWVTGLPGPVAANSRKMKQNRIAASPLLMIGKGDCGAWIIQ